MAVVLNLGSPDMKWLPVRVMWTDKQSRLVILKADSKEPLPALELASSGSVVLQKEAAALGASIVSYIANPALHPSLIAARAEHGSATIQARPGRVTAVREKRGTPWFYQIDTTVPPGYSGGPVLDEQGRVIGMIVTGLPETDIHYILPVDATSAPFAAVALDFEPPPLLYRDRHAPVDWTVKVYSRTSLTKDATVEIRLKGNGTAGRTFGARTTGETCRHVPE